MGTGRSGISRQVVRDGIVNEDRYSRARTKILFIAKEPHNQDVYDYREWWREEIAHAFSYRMAEWSYGILNDFPQYNDIWSDPDGAHGALPSIAFMNIKKSGGHGNSEFASMMAHAEMNFHFLHQQIDIISPDIIITGTTWRELRNRLFPSVTWTNSGYDVASGRHGSAKVIDFYHPSSKQHPQPRTACFRTSSTRGDPASCRKADGYRATICSTANTWRRMASS